MINNGARGGGSCFFLSHSFQVHDSVLSNYFSCQRGKKISERRKSRSEPISSKAGETSGEIITSLKISGIKLDNFLLDLEEIKD